MPDIQAVVAYEGFSFHSELEVKDLERFLGVAEAEPGELHGDLGLSLFELVYEHRPELDCYLLADVVPRWSRVTRRQHMSDGSSTASRKCWSSTSVCSKGCGSGTRRRSSTT